MTREDSSEFLAKTDPAAVGPGEALFRNLFEVHLIGVQTLNEFARVVAGKLGTPWRDVILRLQTIQQLCEPAIPLTLAVHQRGLRIAQAHGYHIYDALMLAAALEASCTVFYSEDMHDGHVVGGMTIRNPFG